MTPCNGITSAILICAATLAGAENLDGRVVQLEAEDGTVIDIATLSGTPEAYEVEMNPVAFSDHFLSMRPFKCIDGPSKTWCHVPYPYPIRRDVSADFVDLEYDFLFVWKDADEYGIDMWNGVYYVLEADGGTLVGRMHEMDMDILAVPPAPENLRPVTAKDLEVADPESHWLPRLVIR